MSERKNNKERMRERKGELSRERDYTKEGVRDR